MSMPLSEGDYERYEPSGEYPLPLLLAALPIFALVSAGLGTALGAMRADGSWFILLPPVIAGGVLGWIGARILQAIHFRNPTIAWMLGAAFGCFVFLTQFYYLMLRQAGPENWFRLDLLPIFIFLDVNSWIFDPGKNPPPPMPLLNWALFFAEMIGAGAVAGILFWRATYRAFCEICQAWTTDVDLRLPVPSGMSIKQALLEGKLAELPSQRTLLGDPGQQPHLVLRLEGCFHDGDPKSATAWLTVTPHHIDNGFTRNANELIQAELTLDDLRHLAAKIPALLPGNAGPQKPA